jgi:predicted PurR-regulated permease PerM
MVKVGKPRTLEDVTSLLGAVAVTVLAVIIVSVLYLGREIFVPVALAILLSFVLAAPVSACAYREVSR